MQSLFVNSHPCSILLFNLILFVLFYNTVAVIKLSPNETFPAIFVFGDSTVDTGNNNNRVTPSKANYRPYGNDFKGKVATGRFSNGKVPSDMIGINSWYLSLVVLFSFCLFVFLGKSRHNLSVTPWILSRVFLFHFEKILGHFSLFRVFR